MARLDSINPCAASQLDMLRTSMRQATLNRQLASTALAATAQKHHAATAIARIRHTRRPKVELV
jgi:hypothetical protein